MSRCRRGRPASARSISSSATAPPTNSPWSRPLSPSRWRRARSRARVWRSAASARGRGAWPKPSRSWWGRRRARRHSAARRRFVCAARGRRARTASRSNWPSAASSTPSNTSRIELCEIGKMAQAQAASVTFIGQARARIDGPLKVTGTARYTSDHDFPGMLYAVPVGATIAKGAIKAIDIARARQMPGVRAVLKRGDLPPLKKLAVNFAEGLMLDEPRPPLDDDVVRYYGQYVALAVADTFEQAKAAAVAVTVTYAAETPNVDPHLVAADTKVASERGNAEKAFAAAAVTIDAQY